MIAVVVHRGHLAERRGGLETRIRIAEPDALQLEVDPLFAQIAEQFAHEGRYHRPIDNHRRSFPETGTTIGQRLRITTR
jgi:hypothetical protein